MLPLTIGSLFSGIEGLGLGIEAATGAHVLWQVEKEQFCREVLAKHYPDAIRYDDVCTVGSHNLAPVDVICGGFPCQDLSYAGKGAGLAGERSGLWREYRRIVGELRPRYVFVENVSALLGRGLGTVLGDLSSLGYDAVWTTLRASDVGAPHRRERLFILANANGGVRDGWAEDARRRAERRVAAERSGSTLSRELANTRSIEPECERIPGVVDGSRGGVEGEGGQRQRGGNAVGNRSQVGVDLVDPNCQRSEERDVRAITGGAGHARFAGGVGSDEGRSAQPGVRWGADGLSAQLDAHRWPAGPGEAQHEWEPPRVSKDCLRRADRLKALGNAVVPQVAALAWRVLFARMQEVA